MTDNFTFTQGSGATGAAKNVGGVFYPQVIATEIDGTDSGVAAKLGPVTETAPSTDTASSGLNGRLQRLAQRVTSLIALFPTALTGSGNFKVAIVENTAPPSTLPLPTGAATAANQTTGNSSLSDIDGATGTTSDAAVTSDANGTISAKLRGLVKMLADMWDSTNHRLNVYLQNSSIAVTGTFWQTTQPTSIADGSHTTFGSKADAKSTATDTTAITAMQVWKQVSASVQAIATSIAGTLTITGNITPVPATSGGPTVQRIKAAASTNATSVKASAGQIYGYALYNNASSAKFFKVYNKASSPTVGTDTPAFTVIIPASGGANVSWDYGIPLGTGIAFAITGAVADSDTTSVSADDVHGVLLYK